MFKILFLVFVLVPLVEIALFIQIGGAIGVFNTLLAVVLTAVVGVSVLRVQGIATAGRVQASLAKGILPATELLEGLLLVAAGAFLLTPGFFTDAVGFACLHPGLRHNLATWLLHRQLFLAGQHFQAGYYETHAPPREPNTLEGESWRDDDTK